MKNYPLIIIGSHRTEGNTAKAVDLVVQDLPSEKMHLSNLLISHFSYQGNPKDDFHLLVEKMLDHNTIILASPVYWYSMSALMKTFLDRWAYFVGEGKKEGRKLERKKLFLIASYGSAQPKGFDLPFSQTADYLNMEYQGCYYHYSGPDEKKQQENQHSAKIFSQKVWA